MKKVISFCLWSDIPRYNIGAIKNAELAEKYYPDFECWFYIHKNSVPSETIISLKNMKNVKIILQEIDIISPNLFMSWRFYPYDEPDVELFMSRDTDTRILQREQLAVREWLDTPKILHIMRDCPCHYPRILGGMFGLRKIPNFSDMKGHIESYFSKNSTKDDQNFLVDIIYPITKENVLVHDEIKLYEGLHCKPFPILYDKDCHFIGEYVFEDESRDPYYVKIQKDYIHTYLPDRIENFNLQKCLLACDNNRDYWEFYPLIKKCWKTIVGIDTILILVADSIPTELIPYKNDIILFSPIKGINTSFQAQCIRILYPALLKMNEGIIISDMDLIPLNRKFYIDNSIRCQVNSFIIYRDCISLHGQYPICFCAAYPSVWQNIFRIHSVDDIKTTLVNWYDDNNYNISDPNSYGWSTDQRKLFQTVNSWGGTVVRLKDTNNGFNRLDRMDLPIVNRSIDTHRDSIRKGYRTDFHLPRPYKHHKDIIKYLIQDLVTIENDTNIEQIIGSIYIMHYSKLVNRKNYMKTQLSEFGLDKFNIIWIDQFDRELITNNMIENNYRYIPHIQQRKLVISEIANGIAHNYIIEQIASGDKIGMIFEDDIVLKQGFLSHVQKCLEIAPANWEILTLGGDYNDGTGKYDHCGVTVDELKIKIEIPDKICTTVSCYLLTPKGARKIIAHKLFKPFCNPIDETLCHILPDIEANVYWVQPWLAYEGSKSELFQSCMARGF